MAIADCIITELPRIQDPRGNLTFVEGGKQAPFDIRRVYYLYDVPGGSERSGHVFDLDLRHCLQKARVGASRPANLALSMRSQPDRHLGGSTLANQGNIVVRHT
jgi:hypothetical protein